MQQHSEIQHAFHPEHTLTRLSGGKFNRCNACGRKIDEYCYGCSACSFYLHDGCALSLIPKKNSEGGRDHHQKKKKPNHLHSLTLCDYYYKSITLHYCNCCELAFYEGGGSSLYVCLQCKVLLHIYCAEYRLEINHCFHPSHPLILSFAVVVTEDVKMASCTACGRKVSDCPSFYHCSEEECDFYLHVNCASMELEEEEEEKKATTTITRNQVDQEEEEGTTSSWSQEEEDRQTQKQQQFIHPHPLTLYRVTRNEPNYFLQTCESCCKSCSQPFLDSIICHCPECKLLMCKPCADLPLQINHPLHPRPFALQYSCPMRFHKVPFALQRLQSLCIACLGMIEGGSFKRSDGDHEWYLHLRCALSNPPPPTMMSDQHHHHRLAFFDKPNDRFQCRTCWQPCHTPFFRCGLCNFNLHVHCIPISTLPPTAKSYHHRHPLTLTDSPVRYYPDEEDDDKAAEFYCNHCEELRELDRPCYQCKECDFVAHPHCLASEIMHLIEEERSKQESLEEVEEQPALTLKEFFDSFNEDETNEVQGVFESYRRDYRGDFIRWTPEVSTNVDKDDYYKEIMRMLVYDNPAEFEMPWQSWNPTSRVVKVREYTIPEKWAPILEALFAKYQNFSGFSALSPKAKNFYVVILCDAVQSMCNTKFVDITKDLLLSWFHSFMLCVRAGLSIQFAMKHLDEVVKLHLILLLDHDEIGKQDVHVVDFKEPTVIIQDRVTSSDDKRNENIDFKELVINKLDQEIRELEKKLRWKQLLRELRMDYPSDHPELEGRMASKGLLD